MARNADAAPARRRVLFDAPPAALPLVKPPAPPVASGQAGDDPQRNFRFFDNRQKYLLFVNTCSEKWEIAHRVGMELANIHPRPPAVRVFDAGVGDGTVLARVMRTMHDRFPTMPFYVVGKEISLEDIRLTLHKMADRFVEHPSSVLVLTNLAYSEAPWLAVKSLSRRHQPGVERAGDGRQYRALASSSRSPRSSRSSPRTGRRACRRRAATRSMSARSSW